MRNFAVGTVNLALALLGLCVIGWVVFIEIVAPLLDWSDECGR